jgi:predicted secreted protein
VHPTIAASIRNEFSNACVIGLKTSKEDDMHKTFTYLAALVALVLTLSACGAAAVRLDERHNGVSVEVDSGGKITITLAGNPTTGYSWELATYDAAVVEPVGEPEYKSDSMLIGGGGAYTFTFKALAPGVTKVKLVYQRSWEMEVEPIEVFEVTLNVN